MLQITDLRYSIGSKTVFAGITAQFPFNMVNVILGCSGCGKTTLLRLLSGLDTMNNPQSIVFSDGKPSHKQNNFIFQDLALWPHLTVHQHLSLMLDKQSSKSLIQTIIHRVELNAKANAYPHQLSGGEKQRLAIARAIITKPRFLFMDEPFSNLDFVVKDKLIQLIKQLSQEESMTVFYVTHNLEEANGLGDTVSFLKPSGTLVQMTAQQFSGLSKTEISLLYGQLDQ